MSTHHHPQLVLDDDLAADLAHFSGAGWPGAAGVPLTATFGASGQTPGSLGQQLGEVLIGLTGGAAAGAAEQALDSPQVQAAIAAATSDCKVKAKEGVSEWVKENWVGLGLAAIGITVFNVAVVSFAMLPILAGQRRTVRALPRLLGGD